MSRELTLLFTLLAVSSARLALDNLSNRVVTTNFGRIRGILVEFPNTDLQPVEGYLGLEYGSLHEGNLRFMPPSSPVKKWDGVKIANSFGPVCPQKKLDFGNLARTMPGSVADRWREISRHTKIQSEDCLYLNIYIPARDRAGPAPVLVIIHGESYEFGTGNAYDGSALAARSDITVVTLNYRLGALGFLSTGDNSAPGNYALFDLVAAMHWIQTNIADFGGDPDKVTVLGHGYGAALANLLSIAPITSNQPTNGDMMLATRWGMNLFHRMILQSGSALSTWSMAHKPMQTTLNTANAFGCLPRSANSDTPINTREMVLCLRKLSADELMNVNITHTPFTATFGPVVDRVLLQDTPDVLMKDKDSLFANIEILFGVNSMDGGLFLSEHDLSEGLTEHKYKKLTRNFVRGTYSYHRQEILDILNHHYTTWVDDSLETEKFTKLNQVTQLLGDGMFNSPAVVTGRIHLTHDQDTYFFSFNHSPTSDLPIDTSVKQDGYFGDELPFIFGAPLAGSVAPFSTMKFSKTELYLSEAVTAFWGNFVKSGNPNIPLQPQTADHSVERIRFSDIYWPKYDEGTQKYLLLGMRPLVQHSYRSERISLWTELIPKLYQRDGSDTHTHEEDDFTDQLPDPQRLFEVRHVLPPPPTPPPVLHNKVTEKDNQSEQNDQQSIVILPEKTTPGSVKLDLSNGKHLTVIKLVTRIIYKDRFVQITHKPEIERVGISEKPTVKMSLTLSITIAVGCALLFLNILIFIGVCVQKRKLKHERKNLEKLKNSGIPLIPSPAPQTTQPSDKETASEQISLMERNTFEKSSEKVTGNQYREAQLAAGDNISHSSNRYVRAPDEYAVPHKIKNNEPQPPPNQQQYCEVPTFEPQGTGPISPTPRQRCSLSRTSSYQSQASLTDSAYPHSARTPRGSRAPRGYPDEMMRSPSILRNYAEELSRTAPSKLFPPSRNCDRDEVMYYDGHYAQPKQHNYGSPRSFDEGGSSDSGVRA